MSRSNEDVVLEVSAVRKQFGGLTALDGASLAVNRGEIVGVIGPNGAGKSTLFNCIMGNYEIDAGRVSAGQQDLTELSTPEIVKRGVSRTFQIPRVFPGLTVRENLLVNQDHSEERILPTFFTAADAAAEVRVAELLETVDLTHLAGEPAGNLSTGQKKLLNLAATLMPDPAVILLDEPTAGVNPNLIDELIDVITELNEQGRTFLVIEHNMDVINRLSDYLYVLHNGANLTDGDPERVLADERVLEAYFGE